MNPLLSGRTRDILILDDFFDDFEYVLSHIRSLPLHDYESYPASTGNGTWPGKRSTELRDCSPFLFALFLKTLRHRVHLSQKIDPFTYIHLRDEETEGKDWVHVDPDPVVCLVYLSETNFDSGTGIYAPDRTTLLQKVDFVQNRCVMIPGGVPHASIKNHGQGIETGRLTLNSFFVCE